VQFSEIAATEAAKMMQYFGADCIRAQTRLGTSGWNAYTYV
jgi:hypothetical protein